VWLSTLFLLKVTEMSKLAIACVLLLGLAIGTSAQGSNAKPGSPAATYPDWASAIKALNSTPGNANLSTLLAALEASGRQKYQACGREAAACSSIMM
jgi:hypothetical protein